MPEKFGGKISEREKDLHFQLCTFMLVKYVLFEFGGVKTNFGSVPF